MLPAPALSSSYSKRNPIHLPFFRFDRAFLLSRARVTNLGVFLLTGALCISLLVHSQNLLRYSTRERAFEDTTSDLGQNDVSEATRIPKSISETITRDPRITLLDHLVIVAGHSVFTGCSSDDRLDEMNWLLEERQKGGGNVEAFFSHIEEGAKIVVADNSSLLVFSGGQTRPKSLITEAQSYHQLASSSNLLQSPSHASSTSLSPSLRTTTENFALDSYQNLLFSIARFHEVTGTYPLRITVVGFGMKRRRFVELHRKAIRWPEMKFDYIGLDVKGDTKAAYDGENQFGYTPYSKDLYGCHDDLLAKRLRRNPFQIHHPYHTSASEMVTLMEWCPEKKTEVFPGWLPWETVEDYE